MLNRNNDSGIPSRCWCGKGIVTYVSKTEENPYRRFFRCEIGLHRKKENHLFKWVDEALFDEIERMDEHQTRIARFRMSPNMCTLYHIAEFLQQSPKVERI
ncbi:hypothetical protein N665_0040s0020 [Sinapis alba]|nr:hypothetical protein N665_0040s0020 [Sinapis alba]